MLYTIYNPETRIEATLPTNDRAALVAALVDAMTAAGHEPADDSPDCRIIAALTDADGASYAPGIIYAAVQVAYSATKKAAEHTDNKTLRDMLNSLCALRGRMYRSMLAGVSWDVSAPALLLAMGGVNDDANADNRPKEAISPDAADAVNDAIRAIIGGYRHGGKRPVNIDGLMQGADTMTCAAAARAAVNRRIAMYRAASLRDTSMEDIKEAGGDVILLSTAIARIVRADERWTPMPGGQLTEAEVAKLDEVIHNASTALTAHENKCAKLRALGYSLRDIAIMTNRKSHNAIAAALTRCAEAYSSAIDAIAPEFAHVRDNARKADTNAVQRIKADTHSAAAAAARIEYDAAARAAQAAAVSNKAVQLAADVDTIRDMYRRRLYTYYNTAAAAAHAADVRATARDAYAAAVTALPSADRAANLAAARAALADAAAAAVETQQAHDAARAELQRMGNLLQYAIRDTHRAAAARAAVAAAMQAALHVARAANAAAVADAVRNAMTAFDVAAARDDAAAKRRRDAGADARRSAKAKAAGADARRSDAGKAARKAANAAKCKAYRERKKAEKAAAAANN